MLGSLFASWKIYAGGAAILLVFLGFNHYKGLTGDIATLEADRQILLNALQMERAVVDTLVSANERWAEAQDRLLADLARQRQARTQAQDEVRRLNDLFNTDLAGLGTDSLAVIANDNSDRLFRLFEQATADSGGFSPGRGDPPPR